MTDYIIQKCGKSDVFNGIITWHLSVTHFNQGIHPFNRADGKITPLHINIFQDLIFYIPLVASPKRVTVTARSFVKNLSVEDCISK